MSRADGRLLEAVRRRWSPRAFAPRPVPRDDLRTLLEAARWAPSSFNEQPWRFLVAEKDDPDGFARALSCLREKNRAWAESAPVLLLTLAKRSFSNTGGANRHAWHDVGLAMGQLSVQATALGLYLHQMAGILPERVREAYAVPEDFDPVTGVAVGYLGDPETLPEDLRAKERRERRRRPLEELAFAGRFGEPVELG